MRSLRLSRLLGFIGMFFGIVALFFYNGGYGWGSSYLFWVHTPAMIWASGFAIWWQIVLVGPRELTSIVWVSNIIGASFCQFWFFGQMLDSLCHPINSTK